MRQNKTALLVNAILVFVLVGALLITANVGVGASTPSPAFGAYGGITTASAPLTKVDLSVEVYDESGDFDPTLDRFVAPVDGIYHFDGRGSLKFPGDGNHIAVYLFKNGTFTDEGIHGGFNNGGVNSTSIMVGGTLKLQAGDYIELFISRSTGSGQATGSLTGHLVN